MLPGNFFCGSGIRHEIFMVINFGPAIFLGFYFCPHSITLGTRGFSRVRQEFSVLAQDRQIFGRRPKPGDKDLTEIGNRVRKVSGTQDSIP